MGLHLSVAGRVFRRPTAQMPINTGHCFVTRMVPRRQSPESSPYAHMGLTLVSSRVQHKPAADDVAVNCTFLDTV
jgi:hypothetical protein